VLEAHLGDIGILVELLCMVGTWYGRGVDDAGLVQGSFTCYGTWLMVQVDYG
jgi:hypothetical protein